jgi:hypothetical protein
MKFGKQTVNGKSARNTHVLAFISLNPYMWERNAINYTRC